MSVAPWLRLEGRVVLITGASSGLGVACAEGFAAAGAICAIGARRLDRVAQSLMISEERERRASAVHLDITQPGQCENAVAEVVAEHGAIDVLVNNAGVASAVPALKETPEDFRSVVETNLFGTYWRIRSSTNRCT